MMAFTGELAALTTACCWTVTGLAFESSGKRIGSLAVNLLRLLVALVFLSVFSWFTRDQLLPFNATRQQWFWLSISGIIGFTIGDLALFQAFVVIGARISLLIMSLVPPFAALLSWIFLDEGLGYQNFFGMSLTIAGIAMVILGKTEDEKEALPGLRLKLTYSVQGLVLALVGALGQAGGLVMSKFGMGSYDAFNATQIRVIAGSAGFAVLYLFWKKWPNVIRGMRDRKAMAILSIGALFGPFLGVSFSLLAVQLTNTGVASTIMAMTPVLIIAPAAIIYKEKIRTREIIGAILAVMGVAVFFL